MSADMKTCTDYFDGFKLGKAQKHFLWIAAIAYAFDMIDTSLFSYVTPVLMAQWGLTMENIASLNSLTFMGMFIGGLISGWFADRFGRKLGLLVGIAIFSLASIATAVCQPHYFMLLEATRFFTGVGLIWMTVVAMVYISEMMPSENRGKYQSITIASGTIAIPVATMLVRWVLGFGGESWRLVYWGSGASIILVFAGYVMLKESPRWLVGKGRVEEAEKIVENCTGVKADLSAKAALCTTEKVGMIETIKVMFSKEFFKRTLVVFIVAWGVIIGNMYLSSWYPVMLTGIGWQMASVLLVMSITSFGMPVGDFLSAFFTEKGGRKIPIVVFCLISGVSLITLPLVKDSQIGFGVVFFVKAVTCCGAATMMWSYLAESFPTRIRSSASGIVFSSARLAIAAAMFSVPILIKTIGFAGIHWVNAFLYFIPAIIALFLGEKTSQKSLEELNEQR